MQRDLFKRVIERIERDRRTYDPRSMRSDFTTFLADEQGDAVSRDFELEGEMRVWNVGGFVDRDVYTQTSLEIGTEEWRKLDDGETTLADLKHYADSWE